MKVRIARNSDLEGLQKLFNGYRVFYQKESDPKAQLEFLTERLEKKDSVIYVYESGEGDLYGFVQLYPLFSSTRMKRLWLLNDLFVDPMHRGKGISVLLINKAKELVRESKACGMFLETGTDNEIGNQLYPRAGFTLNKTSNYYEWNDN